MPSKAEGRGRVTQGEGRRANRRASRLKSLPRKRHHLYERTLRERRAPARCDAAVALKVGSCGESGKRSCERGHRGPPHANQISSVAVRRERLMSQATPRRSAMPTSARLRLLYFEAPLPRGRWLTGTDFTCQPARCISAGR